jgi:hypothetical protein
MPCIDERDGDVIDEREYLVLYRFRNLDTRRQSLKEVTYN